MACDFGLLTFQALTRPSAAVFSHRWPEYFGSNHLPRPFDPRMAETMKSIENVFSEGKGYVWPSWSIAYVNNYLSLADINRFPVQS